MAAARALRFSDHVTKRNGDSGNENGRMQRGVRRSCAWQEKSWLCIKRATLQRVYIDGVSFLNSLPTKILESPPPSPPPSLEGMFKWEKVVLVWRVILLAGNKRTFLTYISDRNRVNFAFSLVKRKKAQSEKTTRDVLFSINALPNNYD